MIGAVMIISTGLWAQQYGNGKGKGNGNGFRNQNNSGMFCGMLSDLPMEDLDTVEANGLIQLAEEEKLARDVYRTLYEKWELPVFSNIAKSEERHMSGVLALLEKYGVPSPIQSDQTGSFVSKQMQDLYTQLVQQGNQSLTDALKVGATIEDMDIFDIENLLLQTDNTDIKTLYQNLVRGSRNHLRAFYQLLQNYGETYEPVYLDVEMFNSIIQSPWETGFRNGNGGHFYGQYGW